MWVEAPTIEVSQTKGSCTVRVISYTTRCDFILDGGGGNPRLTTRCRSATIAVRRPRVTAPAAARVGRLVPSPCVASCTSTCCAAGSWWVATHAASSLGVDTAKPQALACADARRWHHGPAWRHGGPGCLFLSRAWPGPWSNPEPGSSELCRHQEATFQPAAPPLASLRAWQDAVTIHVRQHARQRLHPLHTLGPYLGAGGQQQREGHGGEARPPHRAVSHLLMLLEDVERLLVMPCVTPAPGSTLPLTRPSKHLQPSSFLPAPPFIYYIGSNIGSRHSFIYS